MKIKKVIADIILIGISANFIREATDMLLHEKDLPVMMTILCWGGIVLFGGGAIAWLYNRFGPRKQAPVNWNQHYLCISYGMYHREIEWKHITGFGTCNKNDIDWVLAYVNNTDEVICSIRNPYKRWMAKLTLKQYGALYAIPVQRLTVTPEELCETLEGELQKHKRPVADRY